MSPEGLNSFYTAICEPHQAWDGVFAMAFMVGSDMPMSSLFRLFCLFHAIGSALECEVKYNERVSVWDVNR